MKAGLTCEYTSPDQQGPGTLAGTTGGCNHPLSPLTLPPPYLPGDEHKVTDNCVVTTNLSSAPEVPTPAPPLDNWSYSTLFFLGFPI